MKEVSIIFENDEIILVNKKSGVSVQGGVGITYSLDEELSKQLGYKIHLVHRLDKDTEGILIVAKNSQSASKWTNLIQTKQVKKVYTAVCFGIPKINGKTTMKGKLLGVVESHGRRQNAELFFEVLDVWNVKTPQEENEIELSKILASS